MSDTIFALATPKGKSGVSVIRVSGSNVPSIIKRLSLGVLKERCLELRKIYFQKDLIDQALVVYFPKGKSFTGEKVLEFHLHGSLAVISKMIDIFAGFEELRPAEPGEFTRRAFMNGVLSLTEIEGLFDLIEAETESQRKQAQKIFSGLIARKGNAWRQSLIRSMALVESLIDFSEEDLPESILLTIENETSSLINELESEIYRGLVAEKFRDGYEVAIIGSPNSGKSSLLNEIANRDIAIVSNIPGTTRDVLEFRVDIKGIPVIFLDTAGLRVSSDPLESIGIDLAQKRAEEADLRILLIDPIQEIPDIKLLSEDIKIIGKADLYPDLGEISSKTGYGIQKLLDDIYFVLSKRGAEAGVLVRERHRRSVAMTIKSLKNVQNFLNFKDEKLEFIAAELRSALYGIELLVGNISVEDLLDDIFKNFCIGK